MFFYNDCNKLSTSSQLNEAFDHIFETLSTIFFVEDIWWTEVEEGISDMDKIVRELLSGNPRTIR